MSDTNESDGGGPDRPGADRPDTDRPDTDRPDTDRPDRPDPSRTDPDRAEPGETSIDPPATAMPGGSDPSTRHPTDGSGSEGDWWVRSGGGSGGGTVQGHDLERKGEEIGPYKLISKIGEGGFGEVWLAERRAPFTQRVALKVIKPGMDSKSVLARFEQERQALAVMNHPGIAKVIDGGLTPKGRPYFAMEYVKGEPITAFCDGRKLGVKDRLVLFAQACEAIQHAHLKGIVHRDLKPSNILAFEGEGGTPSLKVIDFGVAKATSGTLTEKTIFTETGQMIGTPEYMSPEQSDPTSADIDTRSDIYSLGVLLYELVAGATPFDGKELRSKAYGEIQRILREVDPPRPSDRLSTISTKDAELSSRIEKARGVRIRELARTLRSELEWIPLKAMRKEPRNRYQSAMDLAEDVRNYLDGKPLTAGPESTGYRVRKYMRRHKALVTGVGAVAVALVAGLSLAAWQWRAAVANAVAAETQREVAEAQRARADERADAALKAESAAIEAQQRESSQREEAEAQREIAEAREREAVAAKTRAEDLLTVISIDTALDAARAGDPATTRRELAIVEEIGRGDRFDAGLARAISDQSIRNFRVAAGGLLNSVAFSPDGRVLASGSRDNSIRLWDVATGDPIGDPLRGHQDVVTSVAFSPNGRVLASGGEDRTIRLWDAATGQPIGEPLRGHGGEVQTVAFSPDGRVLASGSWDTTICLWDPATGQPIGDPLRGHRERVFSVVFCPEGRMLASASQDSSIRLWDAGTGRPVGDPIQAYSGGLTSVAFSPDGRFLASGSGRRDGTICLWHLETRQMIGEPLRGHEGWVSGVAFSPDGKFLASGGEDATICLWDVATGRGIGKPLRGHQGSVAYVAFGPDSRVLASRDFGGQQGESHASVRLWDVATGRGIGEPLRAHEDSVESVAFSPDGRFLVSGSGDNTVRLWDVLTGKPIGEPLDADGGTLAVAFSPAGTILVSASGSLDGSTALWDWSTESRFGERLRGHEDWVSGVAFSPDGKVLASGGGDGTICLWNVATGQSLGEPLRGHEGAISVVAFSSNGRFLASGSGDNTVRLWDVLTGKPIGEPIQASSGGVTSVAISPDGRILASGSEDSSICLRDAATGQSLGERLQGHENHVLCLAFSPDGTILASGGEDGTIRLWDTATRRPLGEPLRGHEGPISVVAFSPDGLVLASGGEDKSIRLWDAVPLRERIGEIRERASQVDLVRSMLAERIATIGPDTSEVSAFAEEVRTDPRFAGDLRTAALLVVGEVADSRQAQRRVMRRSAEAERRKVMEAYRERDWTRALMLLSRVSMTELPDAHASLWYEASFWHTVSSAGLVELPSDAPERDLDRLLAYAVRAVQLSEWQDSAMLDTLARVYWERRDAATAIGVQREAVAASEAALAALDDAAGREGDVAQGTGTTENAVAEANAARQRAAIVDALAELRATLARYEREKAASRDAESPPQDPGGVP